MRFVDLSHPLVDGQPPFPGDPACRIRPHARIPHAAYNVSKLEFGTHQGTHLDAPRHFYTRGRAVDKLSLDRFYGPAAMVDLAPTRRLKPGSMITAEMLSPFARIFRPGARVLLRSGWDSRWGRKDYFDRYPSLTPEATEWIASRRIALLGMDTPGPGVDWLKCHRILLQKRREIVIVENLRNLSRLPPRFILVAFPLNLQEMDASPIRAVAVV